MFPTPLSGTCMILASNIALWVSVILFSFFDPSGSLTLLLFTYFFLIFIFLLHFTLQLRAFPSLLIASWLHPQNPSPRVQDCPSCPLVPLPKLNILFSIINTSLYIISYHIASPLQCFSILKCLKTLNQYMQTKQPILAAQWPVYGTALEF